MKTIEKIEKHVNEFTLSAAGTLMLALSVLTAAVVRLSLTDVVNGLENIGSIGEVDDLLTSASAALNICLFLSAVLLGGYKAYDTFFNFEEIYLLENMSRPVFEGYDGAGSVERYPELGAVDCDMNREGMAYVVVETSGPVNSDTDPDTVGYTVSIPKDHFLYSMEEYLNGSRPYELSQIGTEDETYGNAEEAFIVQIIEGNGVSLFSEKIS